MFSVKAKKLKYKLEWAKFTSKLYFFGALVFYDSISFFWKKYVQYLNVFTLIKVKLLSHFIPH